MANQTTLTDAVVAKTRMVEATDDYHRSIRAAHVDGHTMRAIAERLGISPARVHQIVRGIST